MRNLFFLLISTTLLVSCSFFGRSKDETTKINTIIKPGHVGDYSVGGSIESIKAEGNQTVTSYQFNAGEGEMVTCYILKDNTLELIKFTEGKTGDKAIISEMSVLSPLFKTEKNIGVGDNLLQLIDTYHDVIIYYTYVSDRFIVEATSLEGVQFDLDPEGYIGNKDTLFDSDMTNLTEDNFIMDVKIISIRVY